MKLKLSWQFYAVCLIMINIVFAVSAYFVKDSEYSCEMSDLQAMHSAEMSVRMEWFETIPDKTVEYWYDALQFSLIPISESKPAPYGAGTKIKADALRYFRKETDLDYNYDESLSYEDKIIHVIVSPETDDLNIQLKWIDTD
ncbi:MAG: hypothetical protein J6I76_19535 [Oribacterium sp.]|nr:hypothetical protein [Oribacterium sp.]